MKKIFTIPVIIFLLASCYVSKEHRLWSKREKKNLPDEYFYHVLKDTVKRSAIKLVYDYPYVHVAQDTFFHPYTFTDDGKVYSDAWRKETPTFANIYERQHFVGYYKLYGDTLVIEKIAAWTLGKKIPWKYVHVKTVGVVSGDTIKIPRQSVEINQKNTLKFPPDNYLILGKKNK